MRYNQLGNTGLRVSELCLGTMTFGGGNHELWSAIGDLQQQDADDLVRSAFDAGINFIDTADVYGDGRSEEITGQALKNLGLRRDEFVIATKFSGDTGTGPNMRGGSRYHIMHAVKESLRRLQVDHIDLYQMHDFDDKTPMAETLDALDSLVQSGLVRYVGVSNWAAWQVAKGLGLTERRGSTRIESVQAHYTIASRDLEREIVPLLLSEKVGLMIWSPLASGFLSGKYDRNDAQNKGGRRAVLDFPPLDKTRGWAIIDAMRPIAEAKRVSVAQIALAWLLHQPVVTSIIIGVKRKDQLEDNIGATKVTLTNDELRALNEVSKLVPEYVEWMREMSGENTYDPRDQKTAAAR